MTMTNDLQGTDRPPAPVRVAVAAVFAGVGVHVIGLVLELASPRAIERAVRRGPGAADPALAHTAATVGVTVAVVSTVVICGLGVFLALAMRRGRNWARVTLTVFAALELINALGYVAHSVFGARFPGVESSPTLTVVRVLIGVTALVFLVSAYRRPAGKFFASRRPAPIA